MTASQAMAAVVLAAVLLLAVALSVAGRRHPQPSVRQPAPSDDGAAPVRDRTVAHPAPGTAQPSADPPRPFARDNGLIIGSTEGTEP